MSDKIVDLDKYRIEKFEKNLIRASPTLKAFVPDECYIYPQMGIAIHVLFITDKSVHYDTAPIYVMEDHLGNIFAEILDDNSCKGWHELHKDAFLKLVEDNLKPPPAVG